MFRRNGVALGRVVYPDIFNIFICNRRGNLQIFQALKEIIGFNGATDKLQFV